MPLTVGSIEVRTLINILHFTASVLLCSIFSFKGAEKQFTICDFDFTTEVRCSNVHKTRPHFVEKHTSHYPMHLILSQV